jgi:hypothetical protein
MTGASDAEVIALLERYKCPTPFHEVRTRFLGNIASPVLGASPMETFKQLWGGELPEFDSMEAVDELLNVLVAGLWNRLTAHQSSRNPFRLLRFDVTQTREGLKRFALVRRQELDGFVEGLFGLEEHIDLPERAHQALGVLAEMRAISSRRKSPHSGGRSHRAMPNARGHRTPKQIYPQLKDVRTARSKSSSLNGLRRKATAPPHSA